MNKRVFAGCDKKLVEMLKAHKPVKIERKVVPNLFINNMKDSNAQPK